MTKEECITGKLSGVNRAKEKMSDLKTKSRPGSGRVFLPEDQARSLYQAGKQSPGLTLHERQVYVFVFDGDRTGMRKPGIPYR